MLYNARYLTKLCDQVVCLISDEHSAKLIFKDQPPNSTVDKGDEGGSPDFDDDGVFEFEVEETKKEEENAIPKQGFSVSMVNINRIITHFP